MAGAVPQRQAGEADDPVCDEENGRRVVAPVAGCDVARHGQAARAGSRDGQVFGDRDGRGLQLDGARHAEVDRVARTGRRDLVAQRPRAAVGQAGDRQRGGWGLQGEDRAQEQATTKRESAAQLGHRLS